MNCNMTTSKTLRSIFSLLLLLLIYQFFKLTINCIDTSFLLKEHGGLYAVTSFDFLTGVHDHLYGDAIETLTGIIE